MGCATVGWIADARCGLAGPPNPATLVKLVATEEYKPYSVAGKPPQGEVCLHGANIATGYFRLDDQTSAAFREHADGRRWFHTGDVGEWTPDGTLKIIDRVKDLVKFASGEYVSLGRLEQEIRALPLVDNACAHANTDRGLLAVVVVPAIIGVAAHLGVPKDSVTVADLAARDDVNRAILDSIQHMCKHHRMKHWEIPVQVVLADEAWTPENFLTAAMKVRRKLVYDHFAGALEDAYRRAQN
jgi:long-chain acyl-CoA synthetase